MDWARILLLRIHVMDWTCEIGEGRQKQLPGLICKSIFIQLMIGQKVGQGLRLFALDQISWSWPLIEQCVDVRWLKT